MIFYIDTSVLVRILFGQKNTWKEWGKWKKAYTSTLERVECRRVTDRFRLELAWNDHTVAHVGNEVRRLESFLTRIAITNSVMERAAMPMPTTIKTLDAIHLASAILLRERRHPNLIFVSHDQQQIRAAQALGFECVGD